MPTLEAVLNLSLVKKMGGSLLTELAEEFGPLSPEEGRIYQALWDRTACNRTVDTDVLCGPEWVETFGVDPQQLVHTAVPIADATPGQDYLLLVYILPCPGEEIDDGPYVFPVTSLGDGSVVATGPTKATIRRIVPIHLEESIVMGGEVVGFSASRLVPVVLGQEIRPPGQTDDFSLADSPPFFVCPMPTEISDRERALWKLFPPLV